jgi:hypothetical protein
MLTVNNKELEYNFIFILNNNKLLLITNYNLLPLLIHAIPVKKTRNTLTSQKMYVKKIFNNPRPRIAQLDMVVEPINKHKGMKLYYTIIFLSCVYKIILYIYVHLLDIKSCVRMDSCQKFK